MRNITERNINNIGNVTINRNRHRAALVARAAHSTTTNPLNDGCRCRYLWMKSRADWEWEIGEVSIYTYMNAVGQNRMGGVRRYDILVVCRHHPEG